MLEEIVESAKSQFVERLASPLLGSFAVSWCLWNYKFFVIIFSAATVSQTFKLIETFVFPDNLTLIFHGILLPLTSAFVYLFVYPYPAKLIYEITRKHAKAMDEIRKKYDGMELLTLEKSRSLRAEVAVADAKHKAEIDHLNEIIVELKAVQGKLAESSASLSENQRIEVAAMQPDSMLYLGGVNQPPISEKMDQVLQVFSGKQDSMKESAVIERAGLSVLDTKYSLGELVRRKLLSQHRGVEGTGYSLTHEGRGWLLTKGAISNIAPAEG